MKKVIILVLVFLLIGVGSVFAMGAPKEIPQPKAFVISVEGDSQIKRNDQWSKLRKDHELEQGDIVRTGTDGEVAINFYDSSTSRIGPSSEVSLDHLFIDESNYAKTNVGLMVSIGRVWSRIIQLTDKEASFEVGSDATVATVRGTAFDFEVTKEGIARVNTAENIVEVATIKTRDGVREIISRIDLVEGQTAQVDQKKELEGLREIRTEVISEEVKKQEWFRENIKRDEEFKKEIEQKQRKVIEDLAGALPGTALYGIKKTAENIRLAVTNNQEKKEELEFSYASRRLAEAQELAGLGEKELAQKAMEEFEKKAEGLAEKRKEFEKSGEDIGKIERIENNIRNQINIQKGSLGEATPDQEIHKLKVELERIEIEPAKPTSEEPTRTEPIWEAVKEPLKNSTKENSSIRETEKVELNINQLEMEKTYDQKADIGSVFKEIIKEEPVSNY